MTAAVPMTTIEWQDDVVEWLTEQIMLLPRSSDPLCMNVFPTTDGSVKRCHLAYDHEYTCTAANTVFRFPGHEEDYPLRQTLRECLSAIKGHVPGNCLADHICLINDDGDICCATTWALFRIGSRAFGWAPPGWVEKFDG